MEKIIMVDLKDKYDLVEKYDDHKASSELLKYVINQALLLKREDKPKIILQNSIKTEMNCVEVLKSGLKDEYVRSLREYKRNNVKQIFFFLLGTFFIFLSSLIKDNTIWKEILLISGWVPIWEMVEVELFPDIEGRRKRKAIKKLLMSEINEEKTS